MTHLKKQHSWCVQLLSEKYIFKKITNFKCWELEELTRLQERCLRTTKDQTKDRCPTNTPDECKGCREESILQTKVGIKDWYVKEVKLITGCWRVVTGCYRGATRC